MYFISTVETDCFGLFQGGENRYNFIKMKHHSKHNTKCS